ncbi:hypothetical protein TSUD_11270 [Trifolium subterraneum]|nr:hypothetical protein TSUD_11270 [Trifolium subterraneum]
MLVDGFEVFWLSAPCQDLCGNPTDCYLRETTWSPKCSDHGDYCITTMGFHVHCGKMNNFELHQSCECLWKVLCTALPKDFYKL